MKERAYIGIDPGKTGAMAIIVPGGIGIMDYSNGYEVFNQLSEWRDDYDLVAYMEKLHAMPKGTIANFSKGENYGIYQGILLSLGIPHSFVTPQKWQKTMLSDASGQTTKKKSLDVARRLYPKFASTYLKRQKDHGRSDALLIATYAKSSNILV